MQTLDNIKIQDKEFCFHEIFWSIKNGPQVYKIIDYNFPTTSEDNYNNLAPVCEIKWEVWIPERWFEYGIRLSINSSAIKINKPDCLIVIE